MGKLDERLYVASKLHYIDEQEKNICKGDYKQELLTLDAILVAISRRGFTTTTMRKIRGEIPIDGTSVPTDVIKLHLKENGVKYIEDDYALSIKWKGFEV